jgi:hypothetical protein
MITDISVDLVPSRHAPKRTAHRDNASDLLERLDSRRQPGITFVEFQGLFARCKCGIITTRRAFEAHSCRIRNGPVEVIDLTGDD